MGKDALTQNPSELLADLPYSLNHGWREADKAQGNRLDRALFEEVNVRDRRVFAMRLYGRRLKPNAAEQKVHFG